MRRVDVAKLTAFALFCQALGSVFAIVLDIFLFRNFAAVPFHAVISLLVGIAALIAWLISERISI